MHEKKKERLELIRKKYCGPLDRLRRGRKRFRDILFLSGRHIYLDVILVTCPRIIINNSNVLSLSYTYY